MLYILLPAYNEEEGLEHLLDRIKRIGESLSLKYKVIIVNDGSTDRTALVIRSYSKAMPIETIDFAQNRGIAAVFSAGFKKVSALAGDDDICVTMDSDNTQSPYVMLDMLKVMDVAHGADIVIASRFAKGGGMVGAPFVRKILSIGVSHILRNVIALKGVKDYSTFYRSYRVGLIKKAFAKYGDDLIKGHGFSAMARLLIKLGDLTDRIREIPVVLRYDLKEGGSHMRIGSTIKGYLGILWEHFTRTSQ